MEVSTASTLGAKAIFRDLVIETTDIGKWYILMLRPNFKAGHLIGIKESLLAQKKRGQDLRSFVLDRPLLLIAENDVRYLALP
jgi:hypothetical protein